MLFKFALEPEWEARFEANSYGSRPGKIRHDAIDAILAVRSFIQKRKKYLLRADIADNFGGIDFNYFLDKIGLKGKCSRQLKSWIMNGVLDIRLLHEDNVKFPTISIISLPLKSGTFSLL